MLLDLSINRFAGFGGKGLGKAGSNGLGKLLTGWNDPSIQVGDYYVDSTGTTQTYTSTPGGGFAWLASGGRTGSYQPQPDRVGDAIFYDATTPGMATSIPNEILASYLQEKLVQMQTDVMGGRVVDPNELTSQANGFCAIHGDSPGCGNPAVFAAPYVANLKTYIQQMATYRATGVNTRINPVNSSPITNNTDPNNAANTTNPRGTNTKPINAADLNLVSTNPTRDTGSRIAGIQINKNNFFVGDTWTILLSGNPGENILVSGAKNNVSIGNNTPMGTIGADGTKTLSGTFVAGDVGSWNESWQVGNRSAGNISFTVQVKPTNGTDKNITDPPDTNDMNFTGWLEGTVDIMGHEVSTPVVVIGGVAILFAGIAMASGKGKGFFG